MSAAEQAVPPPSETLQRKFWQLKKSRIRLAPAHTTRASSVGHDCLRYLFYERTAGELKKVHDEKRQALFDLGNHAERYVISELGDMGIDVLERARDYFDRDLEFTGHIDGKLVVPGYDRPIPAEIKGLGDFSAERISTLDDIKNSRQFWVRRYYAQLQAYLHLDKSPLGVFVLLNKGTGEIRFIDCPYDAGYAAELIEKVKKIRDAVHAKVAPERHQTSDCVWCPFAHVCLPDINFGPGVQVVDEAELIEALRRREELREAHRQYNEADRAVKQLLPEQAGEILVGPYAVIGKEIPRKAYSVEAGSYVKWDVRLMGEKPAPVDAKPLNPFPGLEAPALAAPPAPVPPPAPTPRPQVLFNPMGTNAAKESK